MDTTLAAWLELELEPKRQLTLAEIDENIELGNKLFDQIDNQQPVTWEARQSLDLISRKLTRWHRLRLAKNWHSS